MNGINVGTSKVSTGYKGSQNTDYIILGLTIVNTNKTYPCAKEGSLLKATLLDLKALPYTDSNLMSCNIYFSLHVNSFKYRFKFNAFDLTVDCDLYINTNNHPVNFILDDVLEETVDANSVWFINTSRNHFLNMVTTENVYIHIFSDTVLLPMTYMIAGSPISVDLDSDNGVMIIISAQ